MRENRSENGISVKSVCILTHINALIFSLFSETQKTRNPHDEGIPITAEKIATLVKPANVPVEPYWSGLFTKLAKKKNTEDLILNSGAGGAVAAPAPGVRDATAPAAVAAPPPEDKKKEEPEEESDDQWRSQEL
ncbi:unnamed protein product [Malus baccata var. baccata]